MARNYVTNFRGESYYTPNGRLVVKEEPITPRSDEIEDFGEYSFSNELGSMRKSLSVNDIARLRESIKQEYESNDVYERLKRPTGMPQELSRTKFVSMAEAIYHYQRDTPTRFHSTRPQIFRSNGAVNGTGLTRPQSPILRCKARSRTVHIMSQQEKEEKELEEIRKYQIKAQPIPKSVIEGPKHLPDVPKKAPTIPEPFKLTEIPKKHMESPYEVPKFKAKPAPKHILEKAQVLTKPPVHITQAISPKFHYKPVKNQQKNVKQVTEIDEKVVTVERHGPVKPVPFSFEKRDEALKKRKEQWIKQQVEEEKKLASQFKAQPLPGGVKKQMCSSVKSGSTISENKENTHHVKFEARPPTVLYKEPFKPVVQQTHTLKPAPFKLTTEIRAAERTKFDEQMKLKEDEQERLRQQKEKENREAEERAVAEMRAKLVHHARPLPNVVAFVPERSVAPVTIPETPKFVRRLRQK